MNKQVSVLEKFTIHLGRQSHVLEDIYGSIQGTGRRGADFSQIQGNITQGSNIQTRSQKMSNYLSSSKRQKKLPVCMTGGSKAQRCERLTFKEGWNIQITSQQQFHRPASLTSFFSGKKRTSFTPQVRSVPLEPMSLHSWSNIPTTEPQKKKT